MDPSHAVRSYVLRLLSLAPGMKVLLLDSHTTPILSLCVTHSALLAADVFLTSLLGPAASSSGASGASASGASAGAGAGAAGRDRMRHLRCIALLRPTPSTLLALKEELSAPRYKEYFLAFTAPLGKKEIEELAEADCHGVVREVLVSWPSG